MPPGHRGDAERGSRAGRPLGTAWARDFVEILTTAGLTRVTRSAKPLSATVSSTSLAGGGRAVVAFEGIPPEKKSQRAMGRAVEARNLFLRTGISPFKNKGKEVSLSSHYDEITAGLRDGNVDSVTFRIIIGSGFFRRSRTRDLGHEDRLVRQFDESSD